MFRFAILTFVALMAVGCSGPRYVDYFPYHDDGTPKPKLALIPVVDSSDCGLPWDVAKEITQGIHDHLMDTGEFYVPSPEEIGPIWAKTDQIDFFGNDLSYAGDFHNTDFIVALELLENTTNTCDSCSPDVKPRKQLYMKNRDLMTRVRIKIIDIRCAVPRIVLYEVFKTCYSLTPSKNAINCEEIPWGCEGYANTACGIAHERLVRNLTARLEEVIWSAK